MPFTNFAFGGTGGVGVNAVAAYGDRWQFGFNGTWTAGDSWDFLVSSTSGNFTLGLGNFEQIPPTACFAYKERIYLAMGKQFNFSDNNDPTSWEEQNPGAGFTLYLTSLGNQDTVAGFNQLQGRLAVFARRSIQLWTVDADPNNFALVQTMDNIGTIAPLAIQNLGDYDVIFLDDTGLRSLRWREVTLNADVDDIGSPVDEFVLASLQGYTASLSCGVVDPKTKNYWCFINGTIYVLSRHTSSKVQAWSTYLATDNSGTSFTPQKFVVFNGQIYTRGSGGGHYVYGGSNNQTYDANTVVTAQIPWISDRHPDSQKQLQAFNLVAQGKWKIQYATDPISNTFDTTPVYIGGSAGSPSSSDTSYDTGRVPVEAHCTHFSLLATSANTNTSTPAILSMMTVHYNLAEVD